ncbi:MAG: hypothetical protein LBU90_10530 [Bacteroidales bacterium]|jgi:hypothetical protein|nr:hypothetical protein [Bacteroidales bacterium]
MFFANTAVLVTKEGVQTVPYSKIPFFIHQKNVCPLSFTRTAPAIWWKDWDEGTANFDDFAAVQSLKSHYARYLINGSRIHWRKEMEDRATGTPEDDAAYFKANQYNLTGARLTNEEACEQMLNFFSKCFTLGYCMHRYKFSSKSWAVWAMETHEKSPVGKSNESSGGSGKSLMFRSLRTLKYNPQNQTRKKFKPNTNFFTFSPPPLT